MAKKYSSSKSTGSSKKALMLLGVVVVLSVFIGLAQFQNARIASLGGGSYGTFGPPPTPAPAPVTGTVVSYTPGNPPPNGTRSEAKIKDKNGNILRVHSVNFKGFTEKCSDTLTVGTKVTFSVEGTYNAGTANRPTIIYEAIKCEIAK